MKRPRSQPSGATRRIARSGTRLLIATIPIYGGFLFGGCSSRAASPTPTPVSIQKLNDSFEFAAAARSSNQVITQVLDLISAAASNCPSTQDPQGCLASAAASGEAQITHDVDSLRSGPRPPDRAASALAAYLSNLANLQVEMHELAVGNPGIQVDVLTLSLPIATQQYQSFYQVLTETVGFQSKMVGFQSA